MYKHLLVPIDGSELSLRAIEHSVALARELGARITGFVAEAPPPIPNETTPVQIHAENVEHHHQHAHQHAHGVLAKLEAAAFAAGVPFSGHFNIAGNVDHAIVEAALKCGCDLIVMVTQSHSALGDMLFGSHTKHVMSMSKIPMLVLH
ncbi:MAG TPA: universal stress protein [Methylibium sp.]|nr:universal stress protein [Methylibium sp.]